ncbi:glutamate--tRNA ligase [Mycoplasmatota bacterium zrk1]
MVRTRFAPSPTGFIHVGNLRSAIFTYLIAKSNKNGKFLLRIEDTDRGRYVEGATEVIYNTLKTCGLLWDEGPDVGGEYGPYIQSERMESYKEYAEELVEKGEAYYCFCSEERLSSLRETSQAKKENFLYDGYCKSLSKEEIEDKLKSGEKYVIRQITPNEGETSFECQVYGKISIDNDQIEDQILLKSDGYPTYNFANVIDDHLMNITHVVRGNEYLTSTPKYTLLYRSFGWDEPTYVHLPHVIKENGKKLSKRDGDAYFMDFIQKGYLPEAIVNYLALLGWSPEGKKEIFTLSQLEKIFSIKRINKSPAVFDIKKLNWVNSSYMKKLPDDSFVDLCIPHLNNAGIDTLDREWLTKLCVLFKDRLNNAFEIVDHYNDLFNKEFSIDGEALEFMQNEGTDSTVKIFKEKLESIEWNSENIKNAINETGIDAGVKGKMLFMPCRIATTGVMHGPDLPKALELLGKEEILARM